MPECIDCGTHVRTGSRCQQCQVERDWEHHEFFQQVEQSPETRERYQEAED